MDDDTYFRNVLIRRGFAAAAAGGGDALLYVLKGALLGTGIVVGVTVTIAVGEAWFAPSAPVKRAPAMECVASPDYGSGGMPAPAPI